MPALIDSECYAPESRGHGGRVFAVVGGEMGTQDKGERDEHGEELQPRERGRKRDVKQRVGETLLKV